MRLSPVTVIVACWKIIGRRSFLPGCGDGTVEVGPSQVCVVRGDHTISSVTIGVGVVRGDVHGGVHGGHSVCPVYITRKYQKLFFYQKLKIITDKSTALSMTHSKRAQCLPGSCNFRSVFCIGLQMIACRTSEIEKNKLYQNMGIYFFCDEFF